MHKIHYVWFTRFRGTGGSLREPEDFAVTEIIAQKRFARSGDKVERITGPYALYKLRKRNMTTQEAIEKIKSMAGREVGYAGLKDKSAVTTQYITIKNPPIKDVSEKDFSLRFVGHSAKMLHAGDLHSNRFEITLHGADTKGIDEKIAEIAKGIPNYFGTQRFSRSNHTTGLRILIDKKSHFDKEKTKFFIHAYQSWLFNEALAQYVEGKGKPIFAMVKIPGYMTEPRDTKIEKNMQLLMRKDKLTTKDFLLNELRLSCTGALRQAFIKPEIRYEIHGNALKLSFELPPGCYATTVLGELCKLSKRQFPK